MDSEASAGQLSEGDTALVVADAEGAGAEARGLVRRLPDLSAKTVSRIRNRTVCLIVAIVGCGLCTLVASLGGAALQSPSAARARGPTEVHQSRRLDGRSQSDQECNAVCLSKAQKDEQDTLKSKFFFVSYTHLEDPKWNTDNPAPKIKSDKIGWMIVYVFLMVYMFTGLAIVCDEFFVPALEAFVDDFGISMDVAGATFMAAGGSMPELFTSLISTFQEASEVGFAAIVGSAVFNVLFVIAVCAIFNSTDALELTWWPLARDCTFYVIALGTVVIVFKVTSENVIEGWEAAILLLEYIGYCSFMKVNGSVQDWVQGKLVKTKEKNSDVSVQVQVQATNNEADGRATASSAPARDSGDENLLMKREGSDPPALRVPVRHGSRRPTAQDVARAGNVANLSMPSMFRQGIVQLMTKNKALSETAGIAAVVQIKGSVEETFDKLDIDGDGMLSPLEVKVLLDKMGLKHESAAVETALRRLNRNGETHISKDVFTRWYIASEARIEIEVRGVFDAYDRNGDQTIDKSELVELLRALGHKPSDDQIDQLITHICQPVMNNDGAGDGRGPPPPITEDAPDLLAGGDPQNQPACITYDQFEAWYTRSLFFREKQKKQALEEEAAEGDGIDLEYPEGASWSGVAWYVFTYPLVALLYVTLPDVRREKFANSKYHTWIAVMEFVLSLVWIAMFSGLLFECTWVVSNTIGIPPQVSAVTVLAAGTSIPDLLSSYIVARNGEGDMAVSSSIGSNIFDVTVGLPLPWLLYTIFKGKSVGVSSNSLAVSVIVLIGMLICVIGTIVLNKWKLTKSLGYVMLLLYFVFLAQNLMQELPEGNPIL